MNSSSGARFSKIFQHILPTEYVLAAAPPAIRSDAEATYYAAYKEISEGLSTSRLRKDNTAWIQGDTSCAWMCIPTNLQGIKDPIPFLQIFSHKVLIGVLASNHKPIHKQSVEQYIRSAGKIFVDVGDPDPRLNTMDAIKFRQGRQFATYTKKYPTPGRLRPLPVSILHCMDYIVQGGPPRIKTVAYLAWIAFFFLL